MNNNNRNNVYTNQEILNLFFIHGKCDKVISRTCRMFNENYPHLPPMTTSKFRRIEENFLRFGRIGYISNRPKHAVDNEEGEVNTLAYFEANPNASLRAAEKDLGISRCTVQRILSKHHFHDYKFSLVQDLHPQDPDDRVNLCEMLLIRNQEEHNFFKKIIWTDESKFSREGIFNRHNNHTWASVNPHALRQRNHQVRFSFNVFCLMMDNKCSFVIYDGVLTADRYLHLLRTTVEDFLDNLPLNLRRCCWYQLDGAPAHCTQEVSQELSLMFEDRWIRRLGPWNWPARSPDLTPLDFYLWGRIKQEVYQTPVNTKEELVARVRAAFEGLSPQEIRRATVDGVSTRLTLCLNINGHQFEHLF